MNICNSIELYILVINTVNFKLCALYHNSELFLERSFYHHSALTLMAVHAAVPGWGHYLEGILLTTADHSGSHLSKNS